MLHYKIFMTYNSFKGFIFKNLENLLGWRYYGVQSFYLYKNGHYSRDIIYAYFECILNNFKVYYSYTVKSVYRKSIRKEIFSWVK